MQALPLRLHGYRVSYPGASALVIDLTQLELKPGIVQLVGPNGAGKSTLLKSLCGIEPHSGSILHGDAELKGVTQRRTFALAEADPVFPWYSRGSEVLAYVAAIRGVSDAQWQGLVEALGMGAWVHNPVDTYSTGMRKRLALAAAFVGPQPWLLLDEPFNGLDTDGQARLHALIDRGRQEGRAFLISLHPDGRSELAFTQTLVLDRTPAQA